MGDYVDGTISNLLPTDVVINNHMERSNYLLTDYDICNNKWGPAIPTFTISSIKEKTPELSTTIRNFRERFCYEIETDD